MDTLRSWIDEQELRDLAAFVQDVPSPTPAPPVDPVPDFPDHRSGGAVILARQRASEKLAEIYAQAAGSGVIGGAQTPPVRENHQSKAQDVPAPRQERGIPSVPVDEALPKAPPESPAIGSLDHEVQEMFSAETATPSPEDKISNALAAIEGSFDRPRATATGESSLRPTQRGLLARTPDLNEFRVPHAPLPVRLSAFGEWLEARHGYAQFFVADERGFLVHTRGVEPSVIEKSSVLAKAGRTLGESSELPVVHLDMEEGLLLSLIPASLKPCALTLGVLSRDPVSGRLAETLGACLRQAVDGAMS